MVHRVKSRDCAQLGGRHARRAIEALLTCWDQQVLKEGDPERQREEVGEEIEGECVL